MMKILSKVIALVISASLVFAMPVFAVDNNIETETVATSVVNEVADPDLNEPISVEQNETVETEEGTEAETETQLAETEVETVDSEPETEEETEEETTEAEEYEATEVEVVYSIDELIEKTQAAENESFFTVDAATGYVEGDAEFEELVDETFDEVVADAYTDEECVEAVTDSLKDTGLYSIENVDDTSVEVVSVFSNQRLALSAEEAGSIQAYGAQKAFFYEDQYVLEYASEDETMNAYYKLLDDYNRQDILVDYPVKTQGNTSYGWGKGYMNLNLPLGDDQRYGGDVTVAVVDTGVNTSHTIFTNTTVVSPHNVLATSGSEDENNADTSSQDVTDNVGHGTSVAGIIAESTPNNVSIMPVKVQNGNKDGSLLNLALGTKYADDHDADIINLSLGAALAEPDEETGEVEAEWALGAFEALENLYFSKCKAIVLAASGNENYDQYEMICVPAACPSVISVGAINDQGNRYYKSNYGDDLGFVAPGVSVKCASATSSVGLTTKTGTSMATPYIASVAALLKAEDTSLSNDEIVAKMSEMCVDLGEPGPDIYYGNGCPVFSGQDVQPAESIRLETLKLDKSSIEMLFEETTNLQATLSPSNASNKRLIYRSSDITVATVNSLGKITARKKTGKTTLTVYATDGSGLKATCEVNVVIPVDKITLNNTDISMKVGGIRTIVSTVLPSNASNKKLKYTSSNTAIALVDTNGKVTGKKAGTATITVSATDGSDVSAKCNVTVKPLPLSEATAKLAQTSYTYTGSAIKPGVTVKFEGQTLKGGTDYLVSYSNNIKAGTAQVKITGKGNYSGTITKSFTIKAINGWVTENGKKYYYNNNNTLKGWQKISGRWYYFEKTNGAMLKGWQKINGKWYYLGTDGKMVRGWLKYNSAWYYLGHPNDADTGLMRTGWIKISGKWYYMLSNGKMVTGKRTISGKTYYFDKNGRWIK